MPLSRSLKDPARSLFGFRVAVRLAAGTILPAAGTPAFAQVTLSVGADTVMIDEAVEISISGLRPMQAVTLRMVASSAGGTWVSSAGFVADGEGRVDLATSPPISGTYFAPDRMGLFWSAARDTVGTVIAPPGLANAQTVRLTAEVDGALVADAVLVRYLMRPGVRARPVRENGLVATFFQPAGQAPREGFPALLVLGGSECGIRSAEATAAALASHGFAALATAYCSWPDAEGKPLPGMEELAQGVSLVPLEYLEKAVAWLRSWPVADSARLGVWGGSKGAELALLLAASHPELRVVVSYAPSHVVWQGLDFSSGPESSWSRDGKSVPYVPFSSDQGRIRGYAGGGPQALTHLYRASLDDSSKVAAAAIPVERINGAVLLVSGRDDLLWPSSHMGEQIVLRLRRSDHPFPVLHLAYEGAGHAIGRPFRPTTGLPYAPSFPLGGTPEGYADAERDSWPRALRFLEQNLASASDAR